MKHFWIPAALVSLALPAVAHAQAPTVTTCVPRDVAVANLERGYGEQPVALGLGPEGKTVIELFVSGEGTWTILSTRTNGVSCVVAAGENWATVAEIGIEEEPA